MVAQISQILLHGLFRVSLSDTAFYRLTRGNWGTMARAGGCHCLTCIQNAPRVFKFAHEPDVNSKILQLGACRALVGMFGVGWCTKEFAEISPTLLALVFADMKKLVTPANVLSLLFAADGGLEMLARTPEEGRSWANVVKTHITSVRNLVDDILWRYPLECFASQTWAILMRGNPYLIEIGDGESRSIMVEPILNALSRVAHKFQMTESSITLYHGLRRFVQPSWQQKNQDLAHYSSPRQPSTESQSRHNSLIRRRSSLSTITARPTSTESQRRQNSPLNSRSSFDPQPAETYASSSASLYSLISQQTEYLSLDSTAADETLLHPTLSNYTFASIYSSASSRTMSTDYGIYYTRMALSQETVGDGETVEITEERHLHL
ncbi:hypothetical protein GALMADRAFT_445556 [Galerina marginata CBS 339.88]|uniref:Uncharacterized protein n=1 Tax=Galerina marginata (strain CBS 339.88) TaxID=685588 RepID=A0A067SZV9_GALM3|nr:hypothetical protein GALMADRAFT_445556 [Galerina marginata CBS 339.88]